MEMFACTLMLSDCGKAMGNEASLYSSNNLFDISQAL